MSLSSYEIELPVNKESPYQQLYRGRHDNGQIYMLHIFPKQALITQMQQQILERAEEFNFIFEKIDFEDFILISYKDSTLWTNLEQKVKTESLKNFYIQLYQQYQKLKGILDFDQDFVFVKEEEVFIIDYGINQYVMKKHKDLEYTTKTKSYLFGQLIFNLLCNRDMSDRLLQCTEQYQIDTVIHQAAENYKISNEILECLLKLLKLDPNQRSTFEEVGQWKLFYSKKEIQKVASSVLDFSNKKIGTQTSRQNQTQRSARPQSYDQKVLNTAHNQSVKAAIEKQRRQAPSTNKVCSSYVFASQIITNNIKNKKMQSNFTNFVSTQQSFFQQTNLQTFEMNQNQYPKTQNHFFSKQPDSYQQTSQKSFKEINNNNNNNNNNQQYQQPQQQQRVEKKSPFLFDGSQPPIINITKQQNPSSTIGQNRNLNQEVNFFSNNNSNQQNYTTPKQNIYQNQQQQQQQQLLSIPTNPPKQTQQQQQNQIIEDNQSFHFKSLPSEASSQNQKPQKDDQQQQKLKTPFQLSQNTNEDEVEDVKLHQTNSQNINQNKDQSQGNEKDKKQEFFKKPQQENKLTSNSTFSKKEEDQLIDTNQTNNIKNQKPQSINDIEEPPIIRPNKSLQQQEVPKQQKPSVENHQIPNVNQADLNKIFNEYVQKYYSYLAIIQYITITVADLNEKLSSHGQIWIVPLCIVFKRAYEIRKIIEKDIEKYKNIFELKDFVKFKSSPQYKNLQETIVNQNNVMEKEFKEMLEAAQKNITKLDDNSQQKIANFLNLDIKKSIKEQAEKYLFTQIYPRIKSAIGKLRAKTLANNKFTELDWMQTRLLSLYSILIMELDLFQCESAIFKEATLIKYRKMQDINEIEQHCNQIENKIKELPIFIK